MIMYANSNSFSMGLYVLTWHTVWSLCPQRIWREGRGKADGNFWSVYKFILVVLYIIQSSSIVLGHPRSPGVGVKTQFQCSTGNTSPVLCLCGVWSGYFINKWGNSASSNIDTSAWLDTKCNNCSRVGLFFVCGLFLCFSQIVTG